MAKKKVKTDHSDKFVWDDEELDEALANAKKPEEKDIEIKPEQKRK